MAAVAVEQVRPPINFFYSHFHDSIRAELAVLDASVSSLEPAGEQELLSRLQQLKERYHFLEQIYKYHSSVEDEVRAVRGWPPAGASGAPGRPELASEPARAAPGPTSSAASRAGGVPRPRCKGQERHGRLHGGAPGRGARREPCARGRGARPESPSRLSPAPGPHHLLAAAGPLARRSCCSSSCRSC
jgi:hypothetical protein